MKKNLLISGALAIVLSACGAKSGTDSQSPIEIVRESLSNYNKACVDRSFPKTNAKLKEADSLSKQGNNEEAAKAENEAVELFKKEDVNYKNTADKLNTENSRYEETKSRKHNIESHPKASKSKKLKDADNALVRAKTALDKCDPYTVKKELDKANAILADIERSYGIGSSNASSSSTYVVQNGDSLWKIAGKQYSNSYMWPIIFWANESKIKDPDLIFPQQKFEIQSGSSQQEVNKAIGLARDRGPWSLYDNK